MKDYLYATITGRRTGIIPTLVIGLLTPLSHVYAVSLKMRDWLYDCQLLRQKRLPCTVISVGNIVAGGTGKTPAAIWIAKWLQSEGFPVGVLLRGYRRESHHSVSVVSDEEQILTSVAESGDEAGLIARKLPGVPVVVGRDRYAAGLKAIQLWGHTEGVLILDDGFQRRQLARDLDILTIDSSQPFGTGKLLPAGTLRETKRALRRTDIVLLTRTDIASEPINFEQFIQDKQVFESRHRPAKLYQLRTREEHPLALLKGRHILAVCGIGNPESFVETLRQFEPKSVELLAFPDHHRYASSDLNIIKTRGCEAGVDIVVTTEKDSEKLAAVIVQTEFSCSESVEFFVLAVELKITTGLEALKKQLRQVVTERQSA